MESWRELEIMMKPNSARKKKNLFEISNQRKASPGSKPKHACHWPGKEPGGNGGSGARPGRRRNFCGGSTRSSPQSISHWGCDWGRAGEAREQDRQDRASAGRCLLRFRSPGTNKARGHEGQNSKAVCPQTTPAPPLKKTHILTVKTTWRWLSRNVFQSPRILPRLLCNNYLHFFCDPF